VHATIFESLLWGFIASIHLVIGCTVALFVTLRKNIIAAIMAFGRSFGSSINTFPSI
jgi:hypothetical protein